jgi:hypothetical protein
VRPHGSKATCAKQRPNGGGTVFKGRMERQPVGLGKMPVIVNWKCAKAEHLSVGALVPVPTVSPFEWVCVRVCVCVCVVVCACVDDCECLFVWVGAR